VARRNGHALLADIYELHLVITNTSSKLQQALAIAIEIQV
jgi:hypothetical protein